MMQAFLFTCSIQLQAAQASLELHQIAHMVFDLPLQTGFLKVLDQQRRRQELADHCAVPLLRPTGAESGAVQSAEYEQ